MIRVFLMLDIPEITFEIFLSFRAQNLETAWKI